MYDISVVIVSYNTKDLLRDSVESVLLNSQALTKEIIVVDNASADGSAQMVHSRWPDIVLITNTENTGYAPACNQGLRAATGRYVMALNSDAFLVGDALDQLVRFMDANAGASAVGPKTLNRDRSVQYECARRHPTFLSLLVEYLNLSKHFGFLYVYSRRYLEIGCYETERDVEVLSGACLLFRPSALSRVGLLDERLVMNYDDVEWCSRARKLGHRMVFLPSAEVVHYGCQSRQLDPESTRPANITSIFSYIDITFSRLPALLLKAAVLSNLALSVVKNGLLSPVCKARRPRLASQRKLLSASIGLLIARR